ncbi:MAG TPA: hypothetical protein VFZ53_17485 [Polyangiaceae bacterium]
MKRSHWFLGIVALGCGGRPEGWDKPFEPAAAVGLQTAVAVLDPALDRVIMLESPSHLGLRSTVLPVGRDIVTAVPSPKRDRLLVLSKGKQPRLNAGDESPSLTVIATSPEPRIEKTYPLDDPFAGLYLDPEGRWAIVYAGEGVVQNPNELILIDLENEEVYTKSIRSFGGSPKSFTFTSELTVAGKDPRRVLVVQTEQDLALVDLADLGAAEITVLTPETTQGRPSEPKQVVFHDADETSGPALAVSFTNNPGVLLMTLVAGNDSHEFLPEVNSIVDVGGSPSAIEFVATDAGLRLAAVVPTARHAALVDPTTTVVDLVTMPAAFSGLARVTDSIEDPGVEGDVALLWTSAIGTVGIWRLDVAIDAPYASIETINIAVGVDRVLDVPGPAQGACLEGSDCFAGYKIVAGTGPQDFYLLDLNRKRASLMVNNGQDLTLSLAPDGERLWAFTHDGIELAQVAFSSLHPSSLNVQAPIRGVFDVGRPNRSDESGDGARSAIVLHAERGLGATVFDALEPDDTKTRYYGGLAYGGLSK